jgi:three-Cys-motif partner protein
MVGVGLPKDSDPRKWDYPQHTRVKHELLDKYLGGWLPILGGRNSRLVIVDGFAGRGAYNDGTDGSPVVILRKVQELISAGKVKEVTCALVEADPNNFANLKEVLRNKSPLFPDVKNVQLENDKFETVANRILDSVGHRISPSFWFVDPFGFTDMSFDTIRRLMSLSRSEVFITLMLRDIGRFLTHPDLPQIFDRLFGTQEWRRIVDSSPSGQKREHQLRDLYAAQLRGLGCKVTVFRVSMDEKEQTLYYMIHATNHPKGRWLMKDVMAKQGAQGTFAYLGPQDQQRQLQGTLMPVDTIADLKEQLLVKFAGRTLTFDSLTDDCCDDNDLLIPDYRKALQALRADERIRTVPVTSKTDRGLGGKDQIIFPGD